MYEGNAELANENIQYDQTWEGSYTTGERASEEEEVKRE